jgi:hypothetical protein
MFILVAIAGLIAGVLAIVLPQLTILYAIGSNCWIESNFLD